MGVRCGRHGDLQVFEVDRYTVKARSLLGKGGYGYVYRVTDSKKNSYALKIVGLPTPEAQLCFQKQVENMKTMGEHPNIVKIFATERKHDSGYILMELAKSTLWQFLCKTCHQRFTEDQTVYILRQVTTGLKHIHSKNLAHRDIKAENILFMEDGSIKICDFGSCTGEFMDADQVRDEDKSEVEREFLKYTTCMFRPPELMDLDLGYRIDKQMDMWMLGCVAYILAFYKPPYQGVQNSTVLTSQIKLPQDKNVSTPMRNLILMLLKGNPQQRATSEQALSYLNRQFRVGKNKKYDIK